MLANLSRKPDDLRDLVPGKYTLSVLIQIIEKWDTKEEIAAGLSGLHPDYTMLGLLGIPTFFVALLNEITLLKEEQIKILRINASDLDNTGQQLRRSLICNHTRKIRDLVFEYSFGCRNHC